MPSDALEVARDRAILFIDGSNWYHALRANGVRARGELSYSKISQKLVGPREWVSTRYYIGAMKQDWNPRDYTEQRKFLSSLEQDDSRISVHLGRLEERQVDNPLADELLQWVKVNGSGLDDPSRAGLTVLVEKHRKMMTLKEKAVDVQLAIDMYRLAIQDEYDAAYLLSADGDFTPPVEAVRALEKKVYGVTVKPMGSFALTKCCNAYIPLEGEWFSDLYH